MAVKKGDKIVKVLKKVLLAFAMSLLIVLLGIFPEIGFHVYDVKELYFRPNSQLGYADAAFSCNLIFDPLTHPFYWIFPGINGKFVGNFSIKYIPETYGGGEFGGARYPLWPKQRYDYYITAFQVWGFYQNLLTLFIMASIVEFFDLKIIYIAYLFGIVGFALAQVIGTVVGFILGLVAIAYTKIKMPEDNIFFRLWHSLWEFCRPARVNKLFFATVLGIFAFSAVLSADGAMGIQGNLNTRQSLQSIIDGANPGDTIKVASGEYMGPAIINKSLTIIGESPEDTVVIGNGVGALVEVVSDDVAIINFTLRNNGGYGVKIVGCNNVSISNTFIENNNQGLYIRAVKGVSVTENKFWRNYEGVVIRDSYNLTIFGNIFDESYGPGILLYNSTNIVLNCNSLVNNFAYAIYLENCENFTLNNDTVMYGCEGVHMLSCSSGVISQSNINGTGPYGITLENSTNITVSGCKLSNNEYAFQVLKSWENYIFNNTLMGNKFGLLLIRSSYNNLSSNVLNNNLWSFGVYGEQVEHYINYVDAFNTVDGKPICYIINDTQFEVREDVGYVAVVNSSYGFVSGARIKSSYQGVLVAFSENITLRDLDISENFIGVSMVNSSNNAVVGCNINGNMFGLWFEHASYNSIYLNNFTKNQQFTFIESANYFDGGPMMGGNYWDNCTLVDLNFDGICDNPYKIDLRNVDNYPFVGVIYKFNLSDQHALIVSSNSTIKSFQYFFDNKTIRFFLSPMYESSHGFLRICLPKELVDVENISVLIDDGSRSIIYGNFSICDCDGYKWIYFSYDGQSQKIDVIPEFPTSWSFYLLAFSLLLIFLVKFIYKWTKPNARYFLRRFLLFFFSR